MSRKVFFSFLGTGNYSACDYTFQGQLGHSMFVQEVIAKYLCKDWSAGDKMLFGLTDEAREKHWINGLKVSLEDLALDANLSTFLVDPVEDETDIWDLFLKMFEYLREGDEVYLDITHSFRFQPMLFMVLLNYAKALRKIKVGGIYYGLYDANLSGPYKIMDLSAFSLIQDWSRAAANFKEFGLADSFLQMSKSLDKEEELESEEADSLAHFQKSLNFWSMNTQTIRGEILKDSRTVRLLRRNAVNISNHHVAPLGLLAKEVVNDLKDFPETNGIEQLEALLLWYSKKGRFVEGFTLLSELLVEKILNDHKLGLFKIIDNFKKNLPNNVRVNELNNERHLLYKHIKLAFSKVNYQNYQKTERGANSNPFKLNVIVDGLTLELINYLEENVKGISSYAQLDFSVSSFRNDINHAGLVDNPKKPHTFQKSFSILVDDYFNS